MKNFKKLIREVFYREKTKHIYRKLSKLKAKLLVILSDESFTKLNVRLNTGVKLNLENPKRFVEKVNWLKLNYRNPLQVEYTDKFLMRQHLIEHGYAHLLPPLIGAYENFDSIIFNDMPNKVFLKTNHASGTNQVVDKSSTNMKKTKERFDKALKENYYKYSREWNYKSIQPKILVEKYLDFEAFTDYKFFVFDGKVEFYAIIKNINDAEGNQSLDNKINLYDRDSNKVNIEIGRKGFDDSDLEFSQFIPEMIHISEDLARVFPFCRVDFFVSKEKLYFGEMTFHPNGGQLVLSPLENEFKYGEKIDLTKIPTQYLK